MATARRPVDEGALEVQDPGVPASEQDAVSPSEEEPSEGLSTMSQLFGQAQVVDEVQEVPFTPDEFAAEWWVIRTSVKIEDMTNGVDGPHMSFDPGVRYRVPRVVAEILSGRDLLMEIPYPFDERRMARR